MVTDMAHFAGLVAAKHSPSPVPHSDFVTTTTHKTLRGPRGGMVLCRSQYAKDLDRSLFPGVQGGPLMHVIAAKAVCFKEAMEPAFADYQRQIVANAQRLAEGLQAAGFRLVSGGTDNHLMLVDVFSKGLTGKVAEAALGKAGITVNKNAIPFDQNPPMVASGIRIGTPAVTSRGMREPEMDLIADFIADGAGRAPRTIAVARAVRDKIEVLCRKFPLYPESAELTDAAVEAFAVDGPLARALDGFEARAGQVEMAEAVAVCPGERRRAARGGGHRHRQDARLPRPGHPQPQARARLDRHQEPAGTDLLQGSAGPARRARHPLHRDLHEGPRQLPVPPSLRGVSRDAPRSARGTRPFMSASSSAGCRTPRPAIAPKSRICPRTCRSGTTSPRPPRTASAPTVRATATASSSRCASARPNPTS